jgi:tRNA(adenine34) deaminase
LPAPAINLFRNPARFELLFQADTIKLIYTHRKIKNVRNSVDNKKVIHKIVHSMLTTNMCSLVMKGDYKLLSEDEKWMREAIGQAHLARSKGEVPIGAVIVRDNEIVGTGCNLRETTLDPTAHAEMIAIREASERLGAWRLLGCTLYVTLEPCPMCAGAILQSRVERVVYGTPDPKAGCAGTLMDLLQDSRFNHRLPWSSGVLQEECAALLTDFFRLLRSRQDRS